MPAVLITCACPDREVADALALALVEARLAACVQILPGMTSTYRWEGAIERSAEVLLLAKTWDDRVDALTATLQARHPYALPGIMAFPAAGGLAAYLDWVRVETRPDGADETLA
ncbi:MAG: divalent-cation tolerance protein CutA [Arenimonas sp.]